MRGFWRSPLSWTLGACLLLAAALVFAQTVTTHTEIFDFVNGLRTANITSRAKVPLLTFGASGMLTPMPATQTIGAGGTVAADACGGYKRITAAGAVATSLTNTFTAPDPAQVGSCVMLVCNVGTNTITLDNNVLFKSIAGADILLTADDCTEVVGDGTLWRSVGGLVAN
jgi:hypothetical protein